MSGFQQQISLAGLQYSTLHSIQIKSRKEAYSKRPILMSHFNFLARSGDWRATLAEIAFLSFAFYTLAMKICVNLRD